MNDDKHIPAIALLEPIELEVEPLVEQPGGPSTSQSSRSERTGAMGSGTSPLGNKAPDPFIGLTLKGTYEVVSKIGEGGMGNVYAAVQQPLGRKVAIKVLKPSSENPDGELYFMREVQAINMLRHPNIITIVDYGKEPDGTLYLVMEHLPGLTLKDLVKREFPLDPARLCRILIQLLSALEQAHQTGIVHCDLKPANIMVEQVAGQTDFVKILDFGIAKVKGPALQVGPYTQAGNIMGTFDYMSPEQIMRQELDGRADIWSVGVIIFEILTRKRVFHDSDAVGIIGRVMQLPIPRPSELVQNVSIPRVLEDLALKAMERNIEQRFQSADEMRKAVEVALREIESGVPAARGADDTGSSSGGLVGNQVAPSLSMSGLMRGANAGTLRTAEPMRPLMAPMGARPGVGGDAQKALGGLAAGLSILEQSLNLDELEGSLMGERRKVGILAIQQRARRKEGVDPEELARRSAQEVALIREVVVGFDGAIDSQLGGTYTVLFGSRETRPGDHLRALECAQALQKRLRQLEQAGEHLGLGVIFGEVFLAGRSGGNAHGESIDRAIELARGAREARIYADAALAELTRKEFRFGAPSTVGGEEACELVGAVGESAGAPGPMVEDGGELLNEAQVYVPRQALMEAFARRMGAARQGMGGGLVVVGDEGTGKSVLLQKLCEAHRQEGWQAFVVRGHEIAAHHSLGAVRAWIRQIAQTWEQPAELVHKALESMGLKEHVGVVVEVYLNKDADPGQGGRLPWHDPKSFAQFTAAVLQRMLRVALKTGPVLLALDDLPLHDPLMGDFLTRLVATLEKMPVLVVTTLRAQSAMGADGLPQGVEAVEMGGFAEGESRALMSAILGYAPPADVAQYLHERAGGNPLFLRELVQSIRRSGVGRVQDLESLQRAQVPLNLHGLLGQRLDRLAPPLRDVLAVASVLGPVFQEDFFVQAVPAQLQPQASLQQLVALNVLEAGYDDFGRVQVAFNPRALREVAYERLPRQMRAQIHASIARFLEETPEAVAIDAMEYPLLLAFHYRGAQQFEDAALYLNQAGQMLMDLYDYPGALAQFEEAIAVLKEAEVAPGHPGILSAYTFALTALRESGRLEDAQLLAEELPPPEQMPDDLRLALRYEVAMVALDAGALAESLEVLTQVRQEATAQGRAKWEVRALLGLAQHQERDGQLQRAAALLVEASRKVAQLADLNLQNPDDRKLTWTAFNQLGALFIRQRDVPKAQQFLNLALQQARQSEDSRGLVRVLSNLGALCLSVRDVPRAMDYFKSAAGFAQSIGDLLNQARILTNLGITSLEADMLEESKQYFLQARNLAEEIGWHEGLADLSLHIKRLQKALQGV